MSDLLLKSFVEVFIIVSPVIGQDVVENVINRHHPNEAVCVIDDGELDVYLFKGDNLLDGVRHLASVLVGRHHRNPKVAIYRARHVALHAARPLPVHLDGEPIGYTPVSISVAPRALRVIVPSWASGSLFTDGGGAEEASLARRIAERLRAQRERWHEEAERLQQDWERVIGRSG